MTAMTAVTEMIIRAAIEVHRTLGPGLLESVYEECLCHELRYFGMSIERQKNLPINYKGVLLNGGYRIDLIVEQSVVVELKCVEKILGIHEAQLLTYMKLSGIHTGLILNFLCPLMKDGIKRMVL
jgi:GxxExxY protein